MPKRHPISQFLKDQGICYGRLYKNNKKYVIEHKWWNLSAELDKGELYNIYNLALYNYGSTTITAITYVNRHLSLIISYQK